MALTTSPPGTDARLDVTEREFERRLVARGHAPDEVHVLWEELVGAEPARTPRGAALGLGPTIAVYLGLVLMVAALASLLTLYWETLNPWGVLVLGAASFAGSLVVSEVLRARGYLQPAEVFETVAVGFVPLVVYAVAEAAGWWWWFDGDLEYLPGTVTAMAVAGLVVALALLAWRPTPLLLPLIGAATVLLAQDVAEVVFGNDASARERFAVVLPVGVGWLAVGLRLDLTGDRWYAAWAHWVGLIVTGVSTLVLIPDTVPGFALVGVLGAVALFFSALVRHWSYTIVGALGVFVAVTGGVQQLGGGAPIALLALAVLLFVVGFRWARWRDTVRTAVLGRLPAHARSFLTRLAP